MKIVDLKKQSFKIGDYSVIISLTGEKDLLNMSGIKPKFNGCYAVNNSTASYVDEDGIFVVPISEGVIETLEKAGFKKEIFAVPFSSGYTPEEGSEKWRAIKKQVNYEEECAEYCDNNGIGKLDSSILEKCLRMPKEGIIVRTRFYDTRVCPACDEESVETEYLGKIGRNNGVLAFVYRNGHTYITKGYKILKDLLDAGYEDLDMGFYVPLSNGEDIIDPELASQWTEICSKA